MFVKLVSFLIASIKSMNPMQKYPHITELFFWYSKNINYYIFIPDKFFSLFRNMLNTKTIEINNFTSVTK